MDINLAAVLTAPALELCSDIKDVIYSKKSNASEGVYCYLPDDEEKRKAREISVLEENFKLITKLLKNEREKGNSTREIFVNSYLKWRENREECINELLEIAKSIKIDRFNCNVSRLVGYCTSALGGGITLVAAALIPFTLTLTTPLAVGGAALAAAGASTALGTSITEIALLKKRISKATKLIKKDKEYFKSRDNWLNHANDLQEALLKIMNLDIIKDTTEQIQKFIADAMNIQDKIKRKIFIEMGIDDIIKEFNLTLAVNDTVLKVITLVIATSLLLLNTENRLIFDSVSLTIRCILGIGLLAVNESADLFGLSQVFFVNTSVLRHFSKAVTRGAVVALSIVIDVVGIAHTSIDIHKGSSSPEAEKIVQAASRLREEADVLKRIYESLSPNTNSCNKTRDLEDNEC